RRARALQEGPRLRLAAERAPDCPHGDQVEHAADDDRDGSGPEEGPPRVEPGLGGVEEGGRIREVHGRQAAGTAPGARPAKPPGQAAWPQGGPGAVCYNLPPIAVVAQLVEQLIRNQ